MKRVEAQDLAGGRYEVVETLYEDGSTRVLRVIDRELGAERQLALYVVPPEPSELLHQVLDETARLGAVKVPALAQIVEHGHEGEHVWVVRGRMAGGSLEAHMIDRGPLTAAQTCTIALTVLDALVAAHEVGVLHRGLGPECVWIDGGGRVSVTDFGAALLTGRAAAPEQVSDPSGGDARSDLYALGAMMISMLGGTRAGRTVPPLLAGFVRGCMREPIADRYASAAIARQALLNLHVPAELLARTTATPLPSLGAFVPSEHVDWDDVDPDAKTVLDAARRVTNEGPTEPTRSGQDFDQLASALFGDDPASATPAPVRPASSPTPSAASPAVPAWVLGAGATVLLGLVLAGVWVFAG
ncbi:MAG: hypothetical protein R3F61_20950 [Myxococcota bacterium]